MPAETLLSGAFGALADLIRAHAAERPDHPALVEGSEKLTYGSLAALMDRIAVALQRDGVRGGDVVAICARTSIDTGPPSAASSLREQRSRRSRRPRRRRA